MEQRRNERAEETGDPRESPLTSGIVKYDSYLRKSGVNRPERPVSIGLQVSVMRNETGWNETLSLIQKGTFVNKKPRLTVRQLPPGVPSRTYSHRTVATESKCHSVPRVTLLYKITGETPIKRQMGPQPVLTREEEDVLVTWITAVARAGLWTVFHVLKESWKKKVYQWRMKSLNDPALKKIHFAPLLEETLNECITPSILKNGFRKCGLVSLNPAAIDTSKIPTMDAGPAVTNISSSERLRAGKAFLEGYIREGKLKSFRDSGNEWKGNSQDHSLFLFWKKVNEDCFLQYRLQENLQANESYGMDYTEQNGENNNEENEEPLTSKQWQLYRENKKEAAMEKGIQKQEKAEARKAKQEERESAKKLKLEEKKKKMAGRKSRKISLDVSDPEEEEEWLESGSRMDDVSLDHSDSNIIDVNEAGRRITSEVEKRNYITPTNVSHKKGDFVLVSFPGKKKCF
ncbi:hypothetical protein PR048_014724 [Dryococelus australis]|uniref:Uncharacterized protein n=1 Tax=Dryococelus australis TaxID=614101 RepID=A0ABQ9HF04_9NEOP|nr:hypothetical protein PR048_014724 [Dryococelus australis]